MNISAHALVSSFMAAQVSLHSLFTAHAMPILPHADKYWMSRTDYCIGHICVVKRYLWTRQCLHVVGENMGVEMGAVLMPHCANTIFAWRSMSMSVCILWRSAYESNYNAWNQLEPGTGDFQCKWTGYKTHIRLFLVFTCSQGVQRHGARRWPKLPDRAAWQYTFWEIIAGS